jgi:hypothetical protein
VNLHKDHVISKNNCFVLNASALFFFVSARFSFQSTCTVFPFDLPRLLPVPLSPAGPLVAAARKKEIKRSGERQLTYL